MSDVKETFKESEVTRSSVDGKPQAVGNVDAAWKFLDANREVDDVHASQAELKGLRRKIDLHIVPMMFCCYTMQFLDKVILNVRNTPAFILSPWMICPFRSTADVSIILAQNIVSMLTADHHSMPPSWASTRNLSFKATTSPTSLPSSSSLYSASRSPTVSSPSQTNI
jgi:hypothetical protein